MTDVWESEGLVTETWESNTTPGVQMDVIVRDGDIVAGEGGTPGRTAAAVLMVPSLAPGNGAAIVALSYYPGAPAVPAVPDGELWEAYDIPEDWTVGSAWAFDELNDAGVGEHVLLWVDGQESTWPTVYAEVTASAFDQVDVPAHAPVTISCGGAGLLLGSVWIARNSVDGLGMGNEQADAEWFEPTGMTARQVWTNSGQYSGNLTGAGSLEEALAVVDELGDGGLWSGDENGVIPAGPIDVSDTYIGLRGDDPYHRIHWDGADQVDGPSIDSADGIVFRISNDAVLKITTDGISVSNDAGVTWRTVISLTGGVGGALSGYLPNPGLNDETVHDMVAALLEAGSNVTLNYDDEAGVLVVAAAGGLNESEVQALIDAAVDALLDGAPGALDTLNELAAALGDDASFAASVTTALAGKIADPGGSNDDFLQRKAGGWTHRTVAQVKTDLGVGGDTSPMFGDGSDGDVTISSNTTVTRNMFYRNLTVNSGVTLTLSGVAIWVSGTLTLNGEISNKGGHATAGGHGYGSGAPPESTTGVFHVGGSSGGSGIGGAAGSGLSGGAGRAGSLGGAGGAGGTGAGGAAGSAAAVNDSLLRTGVWVWSGIAATGGTRFGGGTGGGGGKGDGTYHGGGGGGGGGVVVVVARTVEGSGTISAAGGNGSANVNGNVGGGGGGGGGLVVLQTSSPSHTLTLTVAGGSAGAGVGTGAAGTAGTAGRVIQILGGA